MIRRESPPRYLCRLSYHNIEIKCRFNPKAKYTFNKTWHWQRTNAKRNNYLESTKIDFITIYINRFSATVYSIADGNERILFMWYLFFEAGLYYATRWQLNKRQIHYIMLYSFNCHNWCQTIDHFTLKKSHIGISPQEFVTRVRHLFVYLFHNDSWVGFELNLILH